MNRAVRVVGAVLGLLLLAAPVGLGRLHAQGADGPFVVPDECNDPPPAKDEMSVTILSPTGVDAKTTPTVVVEATFTNDDTHPVFGQRGAVREMRASVVACAAGLLTPEAPDPVRPSGDPRTATLSWSADFETNGRYAVVFEAEGDSPTDERQAVRAVQPLTLAVPPAKPTNVNVSDPASGIVNVTWEYADPEPDLVGFEIRRARQGSGDYATIKNGAVGPKLRSIADAPPAGAWRYQVVAYRNGAPEGAISRDDTVEVAEPSPTAETAGTAGGTSGGGTGGADGTGSSTTIGGAAPGSASAPRTSVNLQDFAATLNARRTSPTARVEPPDPGFQETLPFDAPTEVEVEEEEPQELGGDEPNVGLGQRPIADPGERRRSLGFVAFGLLLFVLSMTGLFVKSEVKRADLLDLDAVDAIETPEPVPVEVAAPVVAAAAVAERTRRRRRAESAPLPTEPAPERAAPAPAAMAIPEVRRRWSGRPTEPPPAESTHADFGDLAGGGVAPAAGRRPRRRAEEAPLDAPGLDVPDPTTTTTTARPRRPRAATAPLPTRPPAKKKAAARR